MEASALQAPAGLTRQRGAIGASLLRLRSDDQLVALFRAGHDEAFRAIHDRYRTRLLAYARQMLPASRQDAEDVLQDVFVKAYYGLRASDRELALRAWLYRVAHNRCIDQLRRPAPLASATIEATSSASTADPIAAAEQRETLRRLIEDVRRLPDQQRSALLMRELSGMSYAELGAALSLSVPAVKSVLVRARVSLAAALEARETACETIRDELADCHDRGVRPTPTARRHLHDCAGCREFRHSVRSVSRQLHALSPVGAMAVLAKVLGLGLAGSGAAASGGGGGGAAAGGAAAGSAAAGGAAAVGGVAAVSGIGGGAIATGFMTTTAHVATLLAAAIVTAGGAVELQPAAAAPAHHRVHHSTVIAHTGSAGSASAGSASTPSGFVATASRGAPISAATAASAAPASSAQAGSAPTRRDAPTGGTSLTGTPPTGAGGLTSRAAGTVDGATSAVDGGTSTTGSAVTGVAGSGTTGAATGTTSGSTAGTSASSGTTAGTSSSGSGSAGTSSPGSGSTSGSTAGGTSSGSGTSGTGTSGTTATGTSSSGTSSGSTAGTSSSSSTSGTTTSPTGP